jgi:phytoene synthase
MTTPSDEPLVAMARARIAEGSKSFATAAKLFSPDVRDGAMLLYAWCRHCDDEIDGQVLGHARAAPASRPLSNVLTDLRAKTVAATEGRAEEPVFAALARVVAGHAIPARHPLELIRGMEMDVEMETAGRRYATLDDLTDYCYHVAGVVGVMMAMVMGVRERAVLERASDLGIAFQLTNIARDVVADAGMGRVYLPIEHLRKAGLPAGDGAATELTRAEHRPALAAVTRDLLRLAERYYTSAHAALPYLPFRSAWAVAAAHRVYRDIGTIVAARGAAAWDRRVATGRSRKLGGVGMAWFDAATSRRLPDPRRMPSREGLWTPSELG